MIGVRHALICSLVSSHAAEVRQARSSVRPRSLTAPMARRRLGPSWVTTASEHSTSVEVPHAAARAQITFTKGVSSPGAIVVPSSDSWPQRVTSAA